MQHKLAKEIDINDRVDFGNGIWREKTPEEKAISKLKNEGVKEAEKVVNIFKQIICGQ
jgi:hypothetical protein